MPAPKTLKKVSSNPHVRRNAYIFLLINTICWSVSFIVVKPALQHTTPFRYLFYRYIIAVLFSLPILIHYLPKIKDFWKSMRIILPMELLGTTFALGLVYAGLARTTAIEASLITTTVPLFVTLFGVTLLGERQERHEWIGLLLALTGTIFLTILPLTQHENVLQSLSFSGNILIVAQNVIVAIYWILAKKYYRPYPKLFISTISFYVGLVTFFVLSLSELHFSFTSFAQTMYQDLQFNSVWVAAGYMAIFGSIIGLTAYIKGQDCIEASEASIFTYLEPFIYLPLAMILLGEVITFLEVVGLIIIFLGVYIAEKRFKHHPLHRILKTRKKKKQSR